MALRGPAGLGLSLGSRFLYGSLSKAAPAFSQALALPSVCSLDQASQQQEHSHSAFPAQRQQGMTFASSALATQEEKQQPTCSNVPKLSSLRALPVLPVRHGLLPRVGAARPQMLQQKRGYNAWSPAGRYFVEGDHVVAAEANRAFQFTGLDSGSFYPYIVFTVIATAISTVFMVAPLLIAPSRVDLDKSSAYECGFDAFGEARQTFSVSFYLVSIMYLLFDIEIAYLFPYAMTHASMPEYWTMQLFLAILVGGFAYEWGMGALEWRE